MPQFRIAKRTLGIVLAAAIVFSLGLSSVYVVETGTVAVVLQFGAAIRTSPEGLHFKIPFVQSVVPIDIRVRKAEAASTAASKDMQDVAASIAVNYRIDAESVVELYRTLGTTYENTVIAPAIQEVVKATAAEYSAEDLIVKRLMVSNNMRQRLQDRLTPYGISVAAFNVVNFEFSTVFTAAIEQKQVAEQMALKAQQDLARIKVEAEQKVVQAQAEADALRVQKQEITTELLKLREIEATMAAIEKWDGKLPTYTGSDAVPFITIPK